MRSVGSVAFLYCPMLTVVLVGDGGKNSWVSALRKAVAASHIAIVLLTTQSPTALNIEKLFIASCFYLSHPNTGHIKKPH